MIYRVCCVCVAGLISVHGGCAAAMIPDWPETGWIWTDEWMMDLSGVRLFQREVSAPSTPAEVARILSRRFPELNRLTVLDGHILLSGLGGAYHWLAKIERDAVLGAKAMISAMAVQAADEPSGGFDPTPYAPADARLKFSLAQIQDGYRSTQFLYESGQSTSALALRVRRALSRTGWRMQDGVAGVESGLWLRAGERLHVRLHRRAPGSVLWLQHQGVAQR